MALLPTDPARRQKVLLGLLVNMLLGYAVHEYLYHPGSLEVTSREERLDVLRLQNQTARALTQGAGVADVEQQLAMHREQLVVVEGLIPLSEEVPDLLDAISSEAQRSGAELTLLQPTGAVDEGYYTRRTYDLAVVGSYHDIGYFLSRIASLPRIITPTALQLTLRQAGESGPDERLEARFSIETYVLPPLGGGSEVVYAGQ
jgi:type IV pilus assembly protein PilO